MLQFTDERGASVELTPEACTIAGYTGRAIERALYLDDRITVARQLQQAMLTDLNHRFERVSARAQKPKLFFT